MTRRGRKGRKRIPDQRTPQVVRFARRLAAIHDRHHAAGKGWHGETLTLWREQMDDVCDRLPDGVVIDLAGGEARDRQGGWWRPWDTKPGVAPRAYKVGDIVWMSPGRPAEITEVEPRVRWVWLTPAPEEVPA